MIGLAILLPIVLMWMIRVIWKRFLASENHDRLPEPPGPYGLPLLGYLPYLGKRPHLTFTKLADQYGEIFQVSLGLQKVVVLNSLEIIKDAFGKDPKFAGRPNSPSFNIFVNNSLNAFSFRTGNARWKFQRKVALKALSMFATSGNSQLENVVCEAADDFHTELSTYDGQLCNPQRNLFDCAMSVIGFVVFGMDFNCKDSLLKSVLELNRKNAELFEVGSIIDSLPFGSLIMRNQVKDYIESLTPAEELVKKHISKHAVHCEQDCDVRDMADAISLVAKQTSEDKKLKLGLTNDTIRFIARDLFGAGFSTLTETVRWAINLLAAFPDVQKRARQELVDVCGNRSVRLVDRSQLKYNEALVLEVLRYSSLNPLSVAHSTMEDATLHGYFIPKGTTVYSNLYAHHRNAKFFPEPDSFKPERFLTDSGDIDKEIAQLVVPFGVGSRRCVGENLARQELALLIGGLIQNFEIHQDPNDPVNHLDTLPGFNRAPIQTPLRFVNISL